MFVVSRWWQRDSEGKFANEVYVKLQKAGCCDLYNITSIVSTLENALGQGTGAILALSLCLAGNDFLPRFQGISHSKMCRIIMSNSSIRTSLFNLDNCSINVDVFVDLMKILYCPASLNHVLLSFEEGRQLSIQPPTLNKTKIPTKVFSFSDGQIQLRHPKLWLPPQECLQKLTLLINAYFKYIATLGIHEARLPDFSNCCVEEHGQRLEYNFGVQSHVSSVSELLKIDEAALKLKVSITKKTASRKRKELEKTPGKTPSRKRKPLTSTPITKKRTDKQ